MPRKKYTVKKDKGGPITSELEKIYTSGTAKQLWEYLEPKQRKHFLQDHIAFFRGSEFAENDANKWSNYKYSELNEHIKKTLAIHHATGFYKEGGKIEIGDNVHIPSINKSGITVATNGRDVTIKFVDGSKKQFNANKVEKIQDDESEMKNAGKVTMKTPYRTPDKKKLIAKIQALKEKVQKTTTPEIIQAINTQVDQLTGLANEKKVLRDKR